MVAFALRSAGWNLRQDIIWHKPSPFPESVTDRCTKAHEYVFLLTKNDRYFFNAKAIAEPLLGDYEGQGDLAKDGMKNRRSVWTIKTNATRLNHKGMFPVELAERCIQAGSRPGGLVLDPFFGSGTTGEACFNLGRRYLGCEINPEFSRLQKIRTQEPSFVFDGWDR